MTPRSLIREKPVKPYSRCGIRCSGFSRSNASAPYTLKASASPPQ